MGLKSKSTAAVAALSLIAATPALAQDTPQEPAKSTTAPGQLCSKESKKKTMQGKGQSPFAACVVGVKRAQRNLEQVAATADQPKQERVKKQNPTTLCKTLSKKKAATDKKSPFAACVSGAAKAQNEAKQAA